MTEQRNQSDGLVAVIQQDREAAAEAAQTIYYANSDVLCEADVEEMRDVLGEGFARHREASVAELVEALRNIANPLAALKRDAEAKGHRLSAMAYMIASDAEHLKSIARAALSKAGVRHD